MKVYKSGGDRFLWFLRKGGVSREPDFIAEIDGEKIEFEFQYAEKENLKFYDFKVSKVAKKKSGKRYPIKNKFFVYIHKPQLKYAIFTPEWIMENGEYGMVPAWRSYAFRVPKERFEKLLKTDPALKNLCERIKQNCKDNAQIFKIVYCIDFLYSKIELKPNELSLLVNEVKELIGMINGFYQNDGSYKSSLTASPMDETRYALFSINLLEDLIQDMIYYYSVTELKPVKKIYENVRDVEKTYRLIKGAK